MTTQKSVYLAHPYASKDYGFEITKKLEALGLRVINPFIRKEQETYEKVLSADGDFTPAQAQEIVESDLEKIRAVDAVVAMVTGKLSFGTAMEVFYASYTLKKPVFTMYLLGNQLHKGFGQTHPWFKYLTTVKRDEESWLEAIKAWLEEPSPVEKLQFQ